MQRSNNRMAGSRALKRVLYLLAFLALPVAAFAQTASLRGQVLDESGAVVPKATVTITGPSNQVKSTTAAADGSYSFTGLAPGEDTVQATAPNLEQQPVKIRLKP